MDQRGSAVASPGVRPRRSTGYRGPQSQHIFRRPREDCQIVTKGFPSLNLTGPKRAIMLLDPIALEVDLRVKASDASTPEEDYHLSSLALPIKAQMLSDSYLINGEEYSSKLSTLELTYSHIASSVEATIDVRVVHGEWPPGSSGSFSARTKSIDNMFIELLNFGYVEEVCVDDADGSIKLSRSVVSVERTGLLLIDVRAFDEWGATVADSTKELTPKEHGRSRYKVKVGPYCEIQVKVAWSLFSKHP